MKSILLFSLFISQLAAAQPALEWAKSWGNAAVDEAVDITTDDAANTYICGYFSGQMDFDPHPERKLLLVSAGKTDVFLQKFDKNGDLLWAKSWGNGLQNIGYALAVDKEGAIYVASTTQHEGAFIPGLMCSLSPEIITKEEEDLDGRQVIYIDKLDKNGEKQWTGLAYSAAKVQIGEMLITANMQLLLGLGAHKGDKNGAFQYKTIMIDVDTQRPRKQSEISRNESGDWVSISSENLPQSYGYGFSDLGFDFKRDQQTEYGNERIFALNNNIIYYIKNNSLIAENLATKQVLYERACPTYLQDMTADAAGNLYLAGKNGHGIFVEKISAEGKKEWHKESGKMSSVTGLAATQTQVYISGKSEANIAMMSMSSAGTEQWQTALAGTETAQIYNIATLATGGVVATGYFSQEMDNALLRPTGKGGANDGFLLRWAADAPEVSTAAASPQNQQTSDLQPESSAFLYACYPNPSSTSSTIRFSLGEAQAVKLDLYDAQGRYLKSIFSGVAVGEQTVLLDLSDLPAGLYFYRLQTPNRQLVQQLVVGR